MRLSDAYKLLPKTSLITQQETPQCNETRFSTIQPSINMTGIRNERWQWRKNDAVILVALVACTKFGVNKPKQTKVNERKRNFFFSYSDVDFDHKHLGSNPKLRLDVSYPYSKFGIVGQSKLKLLSGNWISILVTVTLTMVTYTCVAIDLSTARPKWRLGGPAL